MRLKTVVLSNVTHPQGLSNMEASAPKLFEYGDLYLKCDICKNESLVFPSVPGGIQYTIYTKEEGAMEVKCPKCGTCLTYFFKEGKAPESVNEYDSNEDLDPDDEFERREAYDNEMYSGSFDALDYSDYDSDEDTDWDPMDEEYEEPVLQEDQI